MSRRAADVNAAIKYGSIDSLKSAIAEKSNIRFLLQKDNLLHVACSYGHLEIVEELLQNGASADQKAVSSLRTPIHEACIAGDVRILHLLLSKTQKVDEIDSQQYTPAHHCALHGEVECLQVLHSFGANVTAADAKGLQPAHLAAKRGHETILNQLYSFGVNLDSTSASLRTPMHYAAQYGRTECLQTLVGKGCDMIAVDEKGLMPIHLAAMADHLDCVRFLHKQGVKLNIPCNSGGRQAIHIAACHGSVKTLHWILDDPNVDVNAVDELGNTVGHFSCERGQAECYNCYLQHMGSLTAENKAGLTPDNVARKFGHPVMMDKAVRSEIVCPFCQQLNVRHQWNLKHDLPPVKKAMAQSEAGLYKSPLGSFMPTKPPSRGKPNDYSQRTQLLGKANTQRDPLLKFYGPNFDKL